jgi:EpsI family protein
MQWRLITAVGLLTATLIASKATERRRSEYLVKPLESIPSTIQGFAATNDPPLSDRVLSRILPSSYLSRTYRSGPDVLNLFIAFYEQQKAGESMHSPKACLPGAGWEIWNHGTVLVPVNGRKFEVNRYGVQKQGERMLVLYWYQSKRRIIASEYAAKILLVRDTLLEGGTAGALVRVILPDKPGALEQATDFASRIIPPVEACFGRAL